MGNCKFFESCILEMGMKWNTIFCKKNKKKQPTNWAYSCFVLPSSSKPSLPFPKQNTTFFLAWWFILFLPPPCIHTFLGVLSPYHHGGGQGTGDLLGTLNLGFPCPAPVSGYQRSSRNHLYMPFQGSPGPTAVVGGAGNPISINQRTAQNVLFHGTFVGICDSRFVNTNEPWNKMNHCFPGSCPSPWYIDNQSQTPKKKELYLGLNMVCK